MSDPSMPTDRKRVESVFEAALELRWGTAVVLLAFGIRRLLRGHGHPRFGGMRVG